MHRRANTTFFSFTGNLYDYIRNKFSTKWNDQQWNVTNKNKNRTVSSLNACILCNMYMYQFDDNFNYFLSTLANFFYEHAPGCFLIIKSTVRVQDFI